MKIVSPIKLIVLLMMILSSSIFGQVTLQGIVTDSLTQGPLIGASVFISGTSLGAATNLEGEYKIQNIPEGTYKVKVSYIGYITKIESITLKGNKAVEVFFQLSTGVIEGKTIVVTSQALGQAAAINQQLNSNTIVNVVSEQKIKELPDVNAAESIGRLPGVSILRSGGEANKVILRGLSDKYTTVTIDGIQIASTDAADRGLDLSTISQSALAGIELYKALTSDKDADAIAGSVNLVTKKAPSIRELSAVFKGNYNGLMESAKQYDFSFKYGERFFDDLLGVQANANFERKIRSNESFNIDYATSGDNLQFYEINDFTLEFTDEIRERNGGSLLLDFNTPDGGNIKFNNVYNSTNRDYIFNSRDYPSGGGTSGSSVTYSFRDREQEIKTFNSSITGSNNLFGLSETWGVSFAQSTAEFLYDYELDFLEPSNLGVSGMKVTPSNLLSGPEVLIPYAYNNFNTATLYSAYYRTQRNLDKEKTAFLNIAKKYLITDQISGELKIGGKYRSVNRTNNSTNLYGPYYLGYWQPYQKSDAGTIVPKNLSGSLFDSFYQKYLQNPIINTPSFSDFLDDSPQSRDLYGIYNLNPLINRDKLRQWWDLNKGGISISGKTQEYYDDPTEQANQYDITERVAAGYIMNTLNIGQSIIFIAGLRIENEDNLYRSKYSTDQIGGFPAPTGIVKDTSATHVETIYLPNFQLNIKATEFMNIRLAAYKALARPDFNMRLNTYFGWRPAASTATKQLFLGNPLLKTAQAWNFEINTSFYGNDIGLISVSAFYKQIKDMYHVLNGLNTSGNVMIESLGLAWQTNQSGTYALTVPYNSPKDTKVWGFEFEHQINFTFLPGLLRNFVLSYNASIVRSETWLIAAKTDTIIYYIPGISVPFRKYEDRPVQVKQELESQPKFYGNISLGYDIDGFSARLSLFHQSEYNRTFTPTGRGDVIVNGYTRLDLALKQEFNEHLSAILNIGNLTNIKEETSNYNRVIGYKILNTSERYGITVDFGVKVSL